MAMYFTSEPGYESDQFEFKQAGIDKLWDWYIVKGNEYSGEFSKDTGAVVCRYILENRRCAAAVLIGEDTLTRLQMETESIEAELVEDFYFLEIDYPKDNYLSDSKYRGFLTNMQSIHDTAVSSAVKHERFGKDFKYFFKKYLKEYCTRFDMKYPGS